MVTTSIWGIEQRPELIAAIGRVTVRWASLDLLLVQIAAIALKNLPAAQSCIYGEHNAGQRRFTAFERIIGASFLPQDERQKLLGHMEKLRSLHRRRNSLIHEPLDTQLKTDGKTLQFDLTFITRDGRRRKVDVNDINQHITEVDSELEALESIWVSLLDKYEPEEPDE